MATRLQTRVRRLEEAGGDNGGGCDWCAGLVVVVSDSVTEELRSATWNGEPISRGELQARDAATECPECGRDLSDIVPVVLRVGGPPVKRDDDGAVCS